MSEKLGPLSYGRDGFRGGDGRAMFPGERPEMSEQTARQVDEEVGTILGTAHEEARSILRTKKDLLTRLARLLMVREVMEGKDLSAYVEGDAPIPDADEEKARLQLEHEADERAARAEAAAFPTKQAEDGRTTQQLDPIPPPPGNGGEPTKPLRRTR